jgi:YebC/PmpR family DNA-binding regulatory protein
MSGHSKWHNIRVKKGAADAQRGKIFTRHGHLITIAARGGGDPSTNAALKFAIDSARKENVPRDNIERAIKRGTGELKDAAEFYEVIYEGRGPAGIAVIVECLTDNKNRTLTNVRTAFNKGGGALGGSGTAMWMFDKKGMIEAKIKDDKTDDLELMAIDAGADDIVVDGEAITIYTPLNGLHQVRTALQAKGVEVEKAEVIMKPKDLIRVTDPEKAKQALNFIDTLEEDSDVTNVYSNLDVPEEVLKKIE